MNTRSLVSILSLSALIVGSVGSTSARAYERDFRRPSPAEVGIGLGVGVAIGLGLGQLANPDRQRNYEYDGYRNTNPYPRYGYRRDNGYGLPFASARSIVEAVYRGALFREPEPEGLRSWSEILERQGIAGLRTVGTGVGDSEEFRNVMATRDPEAIVYNLYEALLGRAPDPGAAGWVDLIDQGRGGEALAGILTSQEFIARFVR